MNYKVKHPNVEGKITVPYHKMDTLMYSLNIAHKVDMKGTTKELTKLVSWQESHKTLITHDDKGLESMIPIRRQHIERAELGYEVICEFYDSNAQSFHNISCQLLYDAPGIEDRQRLNAHAPLLVKSQITGKVLKVFKREGEKVKNDDVLLIIEAMKMENRILAHREGLMGNIKVQEGDLVQVGQELLTINPIIST